MRLVPDESGQQTLVQRLRGVIAAKDEQIEALTARLETALAALEGEREQRRRLELRTAELERRLSMDSSDSGTPPSKEGIGAKAARKAREKKGRQESERERSKDRKRGFDQAMRAALAAEAVLAAGETPVTVLDQAPFPGPEPEDCGEPDPEPGGGADPEGEGEKAAAGAPHVLVVATPDGRLTFLQALGSRRKGSVGGGIPAGFAGYLMTDGYTGYQHLIGSRTKGIQQCCQHVIRRARQVQKLGPGGVQDWAGDIITVLRDAHEAVEKARARGSTALDQEVLDDLRERYDTAVKSGMIHNRCRDWDTGNHPGYALACWLRDCKEQVFLFTRDFSVDWTNNVSERGAKKAKRHQAVSGCWHSLATLGRWCRLTSYLDSAAAHGTAALDAVRAAIEGKPWLPPLPALS